MRSINTLWVLLLFCLPTRAMQTEKADSTSTVRLSLLTCEPGEEIYSLFGHTGIRYEDTSRKIDVVFNYGLFSFSTPNFVMRFALGETDYQLGIIDYPRFATEYEYYGRSVWQQTLSLNESEKQKLLRLLEENHRPENRIYRYNYFYDNCSTRPRDKIEESLQGKIAYTPTTGINPGKSFRDIVHQYTKGHAWAQFGIDFCIGSRADRPITDRQAMFAPFYLMDAFATAKVTENGTERALISDTKKIVNESKRDDKFDIGQLFTPIRCALLLFVLTVAATIHGLRKRKGLWGIDLLLFALAGVAGSIIAFLSLFSEHPTVHPNYLLFAFHPLHLFALPFLVYAIRKRQRSIYHLLNSIVLTLFILLLPVIPQRIDLAVVPLALCLLVRSASNLILTYKRKE